MRIVFMGTPDFAKVALMQLIKDKHEIVGVFCQPDKPYGRHQVLTPPEVKICAIENYLMVYQPNTLKDETAVELIKSLNPEVIVVAAFGKILPKEVLSIPVYGCLNIHGSLLPKYRGAAPIQRALIDGEKKTGITIMQMGEGLDTGDILLVKETTILPHETSGELFDRLANLGAVAIGDALNHIAMLTPTPQDSSLATWASPLAKEDGRLDFNMDITEVYNRYKGVTPWPNAFCIYKGKRLKILKAERCQMVGNPLEILDSKELIVACKNGSLKLVEVALEGSKKCDGAAFLNGQRLVKGSRLC